MPFLYSNDVFMMTILCTPLRFCPQFPWSATCLGPSGNWGHWTIQQDRLFFFLFEEAKEKFMNDTALYISQGDARWEGWFDGKDYFNTECYVESAESGAKWQE